MKTIEGVPESITRADYKALIAGAGFAGMRLRSLEFRMDGIYASVIEEPIVEDEATERRNEEGFIVVDPAISRVFIPIKD